MHAGVVVSASDRKGRERLLRYCARPAKPHRPLVCGAYDGARASGSAWPLLALVIALMRRLASVDVTEGAASDGARESSPLKETPVLALLRPLCRPFPG